MERTALFMLMSTVATLAFAASPAQCADRLVSSPTTQPSAEWPGIATVDGLAPHWEPVSEPRAGSPNILVILTDDVGFGAASVFGGPVPTPNLQKLADHGLRYTGFNTTAMCSPTRAALLTGRNHHSVGFGAIADMQGGYPGYSTEMPADSRTFVEQLRRTGYTTAMFGKGHITPDWMRPMTSSHEQWPTRLGFDYFYGFLAADTDQWHPTLIRGTSLVEPKASGSKILDEDLSDDAIRWIHQSKADYPDKPFMIYYATGSTHAPHQAPRKWIERFTGAFDRGWDTLRAQTVRNQQAIGILPRKVQVSPRPNELSAWNNLTASERQLYARYMEVFAGQLAFQDAQIGKIINELNRMGQFDNTLIVFIEGDNGASAEGGPKGTTSEMRSILAQDANFTPREMRDLDRLGGPDSYENYQAGWAWALNAPFPLFKQDASHLGGTRNGMVVSWPAGVVHPARTIRRFQHITDIAPTLLDVAGISPATAIDGVRQTPMTGRSFADTFLDRATNEASRTQYFEMIGNRALYQDGWWANTQPIRMPWDKGPKPNARFNWELYNLVDDPAQAVNRAAEYPQKLAEMIEEWNRQAKANKVFPIREDTIGGRFLEARRPKPTRDNYVFWGTDTHLPWTSQPNLVSGSFSIQADIELPEGVEPAGDRFRIAGPSKATPGHHSVNVCFQADSASAGSGGNVAIEMDGELVGHGRIGRRAIRPMSTNEMFDVGMDTGVSVIPGVEGWQRFNGEIDKLVVRSAACSPH